MGLKLFNKKKTVVESINRISRMATPQLYETADILIMQLGSTFDRHRYHDGAPEEVDEVLAALERVWVELKMRNHDKHS